ncbi:MAG: hypothetical protein LBG95_07790 [Treponema sp.]|nr:hypothetical protein [Treponema sp.]
MTDKGSQSAASPFLRPVIIIALFFLCQVPNLAAQSGRYVIEQRFVQQLVWVGDEYVLKYEVVIERDDGEGYSVFMREFTELPSFQISLLPGSYRYRVIPIDLLEQPGEASGWMTLNVFPAPVIPVEVRPTGDDNYLLLPHDDNQLVPGVNEIIIKKPDELKTEEGVITVEKQKPPESEKPTNIYLCAAWAPAFPLYGRIEQVFGSKLYFSGAAFHFGVIFTKPNLFNPGLELSTSWYYLNRAQDGSSNIEIQTGVMGFNVLAQKWSTSQKVAITFRAGGGILFQIGDLNSGKNSYLMDRIALQINLEPSLHWQVLKQLYLESGLSYTLFLSQNNHSGCLHPWLGVGFSF